MCVYNHSEQSFLTEHSEDTDDVLCSHSAQIHPLIHIDCDSDNVVVGDTLEETDTAMAVLLFKEEDLWVDAIEWEVVHWHDPDTSN